MRTKDAVIVGGGVIGCAIAYNLAKRGMHNICIVEKNYLSSGATGRCGAGVRQQWGLEMNIRLARDSMRMFETMNEDLDYAGDIELKQGGYLILAYTPLQWQQFKKNVALQNQLGVASQLVTPAQAKEIVPHLNIEGLLGATFCATDGHANPFNVTEAYAQAARRLGVEILTYTEVVGIESAQGKVHKVKTNQGDIATPLVINAAGGYSDIVAGMVGIELPTFSQRHQILVTEPVDPLQGPMVISFHHGLYCQQTPHGSFIMGLGEAHEPKGHDIGHSWEFMESMARHITQLLPPLSALRVIRQWSGLYNVTPDAQPIFGGTPGVEGFKVALGFSGHGFMIAPMTGVLMAEHILGMKMTMPINMLDIGRFDRGELIKEPNVV